MILTTLCYVHDKERVLLLHRIKKKVDIHRGKWVGLGGKLESGESPDECICREVFEETGLTLHQPKLRAIVTSDAEIEDPALSDWSTEYMFVFSCDSFSGELIPFCPEGELAWVPIASMNELPHWEGDPYFADPILAGEPFFSMKLTYRGGKLCKVIKNGEILLQK